MDYNPSIHQKFKKYTMWIKIIKKLHILCQIFMAVFSDLVIHTMDWAARFRLGVSSSSNYQEHI